MTQNATNFINPITFETLTGNKCLIDTFDRNFEFSVEHVSIAKQADVVCANSLRTAGAGFGSETNVVTMITNHGEYELELQTKEAVAHKIFDKILEEIKGE